MSQSLGYRLGYCFQSEQTRSLAIEAGPNVTVNCIGPGSTLLALPFSVYVYLAPSYVSALLVANIPVVLGVFYIAPSFALTQRMVGIRMRALAASILLFITNLIGLGLGPQITGIVSDLLNYNTDLGVHALRWAMVIVLTLNIVSTIFYLISAKYLREDLAKPTQ